MVQPAVVVMLAGFTLAAGSAVALVLTPASRSAHLETRNAPPHPKRVERGITYPTPRVVPLRVSRAVPRYVVRRPVGLPPTGRARC